MDEVQVSHVWKKTKEKIRLPKLVINDYQKVWCVECLDTV